MDPLLVRLSEAYQTAAEKLRETSAPATPNKHEPNTAAKLPEEDGDMLESLFGAGEHSSFLETYNPYTLIRRIMKGHDATYRF